MNKTYTPIDHTGDLGVEVFGEDWRELFANASWALTDTLVDAARVGMEIEAEWALEADGLESLLVRQLEEILYQMDARGRVYSEFQIEWLEPHALKCRARGEALDRKRHGFKTEIKAVTYHGLKLWREPEGPCRARIIFDV
ncbi:MAG: archease [Deltaproteobacteria bacterium]|nr:archease [Deltaproteobacteria bacterium]